MQSRLRPYGCSVDMGQRGPPDTVLTVTGRVTLDGQLRSRLNGVFGPTSTEQDVAPAALRHPFLDLTGIVGDLKIDPRMGVLEPELRDHTLDGNGLVGDEVSREGVMSETRAAQQRQRSRQTDNQSASCFASHFNHRLERSGVQS